MADYFGDDDECHLCFNFPLMPRLFMAVRREQSYPITEILAQTPEPPGSAQWAIFLRNHDELTLEMVTEEERDYLFAEYAKDPADEAAHGDRPAPGPPARPGPAAVRAPLLPAVHPARAARSSTTGTRSRWATTSTWATATRCARPCSGPRTATAGSAGPTSPSSTCRPLMDPVYGFSAVNVEAQQRNPSSFLHWMRRILAVRREFPVLGTGELEVVSSANPSVLAFVRSAPARPDRGPVNPVLCVHNLSRLAQPAELHVERWVGRQPIELLGPGGVPPDRDRSLSGDPGLLRLALLRAGLSRPADPGGPVGGRPAVSRPGPPEPGRPAPRPPPPGSRC